jgi:DNA-directed RNA polymerase subunit RPC12/RpoP
MRRVHRTLMEHLRYLAIYECKQCHTEDNVPRPLQMHRGKSVRCPKCGTYRVVRIKEPDRIDRMHTGLLNLLERIAGGRLYHCRYCRIQFWDRRRLAAEVAADEAAAARESDGAEVVADTETAAPARDGSDA